MMVSGFAEELTLRGTGGTCFPIAVMETQSQRDGPMPAQANGLGKSAHEDESAPPGRPQMTVMNGPTHIVRRHYRSAPLGLGVQPGPVTQAVGLG